MEKQLTIPKESVSLASPQQLVKFASQLKKFITDQKLYSLIQGRAYVNVEGWQFAGAATGVLPVVVKVERQDFEASGEIRYRAEVKLVRIGSGETVGYGVSICSNLEPNRKDQAEYVIASMAQTRATGKAYRNAFAWLMKVAGYEATPAEEMPHEIRLGDEEKKHMEAGNKASMASVKKESKEIIKRIKEQKNAQK